MPVLFWIPFLLLKQNAAIHFYELRNAADYQCRIRHNPTKTILLLNQAEGFQKLDPDAEEMKARCYLDMGDTLQALEALKRSILLGNPNMNRVFLDFKDFNLGSLLKLKEAYPNLLSQYYCSMNIPVLIQLHEMDAEDQMIRKYHTDLRPEIEEPLFRTVDSLNLVKLKGIFLNYGILRYPKTFVLYWHDLFKFPVIWASVEPEMRKAIFSGSFHPQGYAMLYDKVRIETEKKNSWYGEYTNSNSYTEIGPIDDLLQVDVRRKEIGLRSLQEMSDLFDWVLPPGYCPPTPNRLND
jgi:tetratricopeptide (TPR) repeat protein